MRKDTCNCGREKCATAEQCRTCYLSGAQRTAEQAAAHRAYHARWQRQRRSIRGDDVKGRTLAAKRELLAHYGGACTCCGEATEEFLTIEHVDGVPESHRSASGNRKTGLALYNQIRREGFPASITILCWNCNAARYHFGRCPHERPELRAA